MTEYGLYLKSGPKRRKRWSTSWASLGCMANGPTTEAALEATPQAIRAYLRFLHRRTHRRHPKCHRQLQRCTLDAPLPCEAMNRLYKRMALVWRRRDDEPVALS